MTSVQTNASTNIDIAKYIPLVYFCYNKLPDTIKRLHDYEEMIDIGMFYLAKAYVNFDAARNIKFTTYAVSSIVNGYKHTARTANLKKRIPEHSKVSIDTLVPGTNNLTIGDSIGVEYEDISIARLDLALFIEKLDDIDCKILQLLYNGHNQTKIGKALELSQAAISRRLKKIKKKFRRFCDE